MPAAVMECPDFSEFQETLKNLRKTDDIIVNTINSVVPTDSFHTDEVTACKNLHETLQDGNGKREKFIKNCISVTADKVKRLRDREQRETNSENIQLKKELKAEQTKLRMLQVELSVEDLIKQRTAKVFNERCRKFYKPL